MRKPWCSKHGTSNVTGAGQRQLEDEQKQVHEEGSWRSSSLPRAAGLLHRGKSCRLRWINYLMHPDLRRGSFSEGEEDLIVKLHALLGNRWSLIAGRLPGRTDKDVKNHWNSCLRKKLASMGIDPDNHRTSQPSLPMRHHLPQRSPCNGVNSATDADRVSDAASCLLEDSSYVLPDLNLDLNGERNTGNIPTLTLFQ